MSPRPNDTIAVVTSYGSNRVARVARVAANFMLYGADDVFIEPFVAVQSWRFATRVEILEFNECLREVSGVRRATVVGIPAPAPGSQRRRIAHPSTYSFVTRDRKVGS